MALTDWLVAVTGAMTAPVAPTELKGPNGSYFVQQYNGLINELSYVAPAFTSLTSNINSSTIEVGEKIFNSSTPITLTYTASHPERVASAHYLAGGVRVEETSYASGETLTYSLSDYNASPNIYLNSASYSWSVEGTDIKDSAIASAPSITVNWRYRTYYGYSTSSSVTDYASLTPIGNGLSRPTSVTKPATPGSPSYLYIFLPIGKTTLTDGWSAYNTFKVAGFDAVMDSVTQQTITRLGVNVVYNVYKLFNPTEGTLTLDLT